MKSELVLQLVARRGAFWEAVEDIRVRWQIVDSPACLPPESEDVLLPQTVGEANISKDQHTAYLNAKNRWFGELRRALLRGGVPERYVAEESPPYVGSPPMPKRWLPWYRFAAACVLYNPPRSEHLPEFALYGGPPSPAVPSEVLTEHQLLERTFAEEEQRILEEMISKKLWDLRFELGEPDYPRARVEILRRFGYEMDRELEQLRKDREWEIECGPEPRVYVELLAGTTIEEKRRAVETAAAHQKERPTTGRRRRDPLIAVTCAILADENGWKQKEIAEHYEWKDETAVSKCLKAGRASLNGGC